MNCDFWFLEATISLSPCYLGVEWTHWCVNFLLALRWLCIRSLVVTLSSGIAFPVTEGLPFPVTEGSLLENDTGGLELTERPIFGHQGLCFTCEDW